VLVDIVNNDPRLFERLATEVAATRVRLDAARIATQTASLDVDRKQHLFDQRLAAHRDLGAATIRYKELKATAAGGAAELAKSKVGAARQEIQRVVAPRDSVALAIFAGGTATLVK
jgi:hypothetical protein